MKYLYNQQLTIRLLQVIFLIILLLFIFKKPLYENFIAYNSPEIKNLKDTDILGDNLIKFKNIIKEKFIGSEKDYNFSDPLFQQDLDVSYYYNKLFQQICVDYINQDIIRDSEDFKNHTFAAVKEDIPNLFNIYKKDNFNDRHFVFDLDLFSKTKMFQVSLRIYLVVYNMQKYLTEDGKYQSIIDIPKNNIKIVNLQVIEKKETLKVLPNLEGDVYYQTIDNKFHLA